MNPAPSQIDASYLSAPAARMVRLRHETAVAHRRLEGLIDAEMRMQTHAQYGDMLKLFHAFYRAMEQHLPLELFGFDLGGTDKSEWLSEDLRALGLAHEPRRVGELPPLETAEAQLGAAYVLEGSMLGGQMMARMAARHLDLGPESGARFFHGYGAETGARWRAFGTMAETAPVRTDEVVRAAQATFAAFGQWAQRWAWST